jgi:hypothetical protein
MLPAALRQFSFLGCACALIAACASAREASVEAVNVEVRTVTASAPGTQPANIPASLGRYKRFLAATSFGAFVDGGAQHLAMKLGQRATAKAGKYTLELTLVAMGHTRATVEVTIKDGEQAIGTPAKQTFTRREPAQMEVGDASAPTIIFLALKEEPERDR